MATRSLEQTVLCLLNTPAEKQDVELEDIPVHLQDLSGMLRDEPLRTATDVFLWGIAANTNCPEITMSYCRVTNAAKELAGSAFDFSSIISIRISGLGAVCEVFFNAGNVSYVKYDGTTIACNEIQFHKGDFCLYQNGRTAGYVPGVW